MCFTPVVEGVGRYGLDFIPSAAAGEQNRQSNETKCPLHDRTMLARIDFVNPPERFHSSLLKARSRMARGRECQTRRCPIPVAD
jgi:hypothetical protein